MRPKECTIWNKQVRDAIQILQIQRLFTKDLQEGKGVRTAEDYRDVVKRIEDLKNVLPEITSYLELDHFLWYVASRNYWRIQGGTEKEFWEEYWTCCTSKKRASNIQFICK